jgi:hypothetical protein
MVALLLTVIFNFVLVLIWRYDFGARTPLEPTAASQWAEPLDNLASKDDGGNVVPDRDLVLALTPTKVDALAERFDRVRDIVGTNGKKPKYDAVVSITSSDVTTAQLHVEHALGQVTKRWKLDEVVTNSGKPSELYYLVRTRKSFDRDAIITALRNGAGGMIEDVDVEIGEALAKESGERRRERKQQERPARVSLVLRRCRPVSSPRPTCAHRSSSRRLPRRTRFRRIPQRSRNGCCRRRCEKRPDSR